MQEGLSASVGGPSTIFPRGYLWLAPVWYLVALGGLAEARWLPYWFRLTAAAGLLGAMLTFVSVLSLVTTRAFRADDSGVRIGLPSASRRRGRRRREARFVPWQQIEKVKIARRRGGVRVELILIPGASLALRGYPHHPIWKLRRALLLLIPFWYLLRPTGIATPLDGPPRYQVQLRGTTVDTMRAKIRALAPPSVTVAVLVPRRRSVSSATPAPETLR
jgi:hypothetical protein